MLGIGFVLTSLFRSAYTHRLVWRGQSVFNTPSNSVQQSHSVRLADFTPPLLSLPARRVGSTMQFSIPSLFQQNSILDVEDVVNTLKADIPLILQREPNWDIFSSDFQVIDGSSTKLQGLGATKLLTYLFRVARNKVIVKDDIQASVISSPSMNRSVKPLVVARWKVRIERPPPYEVWRDEYAVTFEVNTVFKLNEQNRVEYMRVDRMVCNGRPFDMWPDFQLSAGPGVFLQSLRQWVMALVTEMPEMEAAFGELKLMEWAKNVKSVDFSASPIIRRWKELAATKELEVQTNDGDVIVENDKAFKKVTGSQAILSQMADDIECATVDEILALVLNSETSDADLLVNIYAMATASQRMVFDESGKLERIAAQLGLEDVMDDDTDARVRVIEIGELVAMPNSQTMGPFMKGLGKELLLRIVRRAAGLGALVTIVPANAPLEKYYQKLGFEKIDDYGPAMVYAGSLPEVTDKEGTFEMSSLRVD